MASIHQKIAGLGNSSITCGLWLYLAGGKVGENQRLHWKRDHRTEVPDQYPCSNLGLLPNHRLSRNSQPGVSPLEPSFRLLSCYSAGQELDG